MTVRGFIGNAAKYDDFGTQLWGETKKGLQLIGEVRGWGAIQNHFKDKDGVVDLPSAEAFQDQLGKFIADAINEKLERDK